MTTRKQYEKQMALAERERAARKARILDREPSHEAYRATREYATAGARFTVSAVSAADEYAWFDLEDGLTLAEAVACADKMRRDSRLADHAIVVYRGLRKDGFCLTEIARLGELV